MCEPLKYDLIQKEKAFKVIEDKMYSIRSKYVESRGSGNTLYILDKVIIKFLEEVMRTKLPRAKDDFCTLMDWQNKKNTDLAELRSNILSSNEMRHIVLNGLSHYEKDIGFQAKCKMIVFIRELTVVDIRLLKGSK